VVVVGVLEPDQRRREDLEARMPVTDDRWPAAGGLRDHGRSDEREHDRGHDPYA
jgi:hypothetical protein